MTYGWIQVIILILPEEGGGVRARLNLHFHFLAFVFFFVVIHFHFLTEEGGGVRARLNLLEERLREEAERERWMYKMHIYKYKSTTHTSTN